MKKLAVLIIAASSISCSNDVKTKNHAVVTAKIVAHTGLLAKNTPNVYIGDIGYFAETHEFYVCVGFKAKYPDNTFMILSQQTDSVVFQDAENTRSKLPLKQAQKYFDLELLDSLHVYDISHRYVTGAKFSRVEFWGGAIESSFIAVFKPDRAISKTPTGYYCTSPSIKPLEPEETRAVIDSNYVKMLITKLKLNIGCMLAEKHIRSTSPNTTYSIISFREPNRYNNLSYLTEFNDNKVRVLKKIEGEDVFWDFMLLPIQVKGRPVILMKLAVPETDRSIISLPMIYDGKDFNIDEDSRLFIARKK